MPLRALLPRAVSLSALSLLVVASITGCQAGDPRSPSGATTADAAATGPGRASSTPAGAVVIDVTLRDGRVEPNGTKITVQVGQPVLINATSDHDDQVHVHSDPGLELAVPAGQTVHGSFVARESGSFEVESHHPHKIIAVLNVR